MNRRDFTRASGLALAGMALNNKLAFSSVFPASIQTHHDLIPIYGNSPTIQTIKSGSWNDPTVWNLNRIPNASDQVGILAGHSISFTGLVECLDLVVAGTLTGTTGFALNVRTATVLPTGNLQLQTSGVVTFRDIPIDTNFDPSQYGNGLLVIDGIFSAIGQSKAAWGRISKEIVAGTKQITFSSPPVGWKIGDVLVIPDTRQPFLPSDVAEGNRQIELVSIAAVSGRTVRLQNPVLYDHKGWKNQDGQIELYPYVGNLTRSIVFRSANPNGVRGHLLFTGHADIVGRYVEIDDCGRTTVAPLDSTVLSPLHIGTNQIGRYAWHFHHCHGPMPATKAYQFEASGLAIKNSPKWGIAVHGSHYGLVKSNTIYGARGAGIVTETVDEYSTIIEDNLIIWGQGSGERITGRSNRNDPKGDFWHTGAGLGLTSAACTIRRNKIFNCNDGIGMAGFRTTAMRFPNVRGGGSEPGEDVTVWQKPVFYYPFLFPTNDNLLWGCYRGIETWVADSYPDKLDMFPGLTIVHTKQGTDLNDQEETYLNQWVILGDFSRINLDTIALKFKDGYEFGVTAVGCEIRGYGIGYTTASPQEYTNFTDCVFENRVNIYEPLGRLKGPWVGTWQDTQFIPVSGYPLQILKVASHPFFRGPYFTATTGNQPDDKMLTFNVVYRFLNNNFTGENLRVYHYYQVPSTVFPALPPITQGTQWNDFPPDVLSNQDAWSRYGLRILGAFAPPSSIIRPEYDGYLVNVENPISYPAISGKAVSFNGTTATVQFVTDIPAKAQVRYSQGGLWRWTAWTATLATAQSVSIPGLTSGATYTFYLYAMDGSDNLNVTFKAIVTGKVP